jgi:hypothetical protein
MEVRIPVGLIRNLRENLLFGLSESAAEPFRPVVLNLKLCK